MAQHSFGNEVKDSEQTRYAMVLSICCHVVTLRRGHGTASVVVPSTGIDAGGHRGLIERCLELVKTLTAMRTRSACWNCIFCGDSTIKPSTANLLLDRLPIHVHVSDEVTPVVTWEFIFQERFLCTDCFHRRLALQGHELPVLRREQRPIRNRSKHILAIRNSRNALGSVTVDEGCPTTAHNVGHVLVAGGGSLPGQGAQYFCVVPPHERQLKSVGIAECLLHFAADEFLVMLHLQCSRTRPCWPSSSCVCPGLLYLTSLMFKMM